MGYIKNVDGITAASDSAIKSVGGMILLSKQTASGAPVIFTSAISSTYKNYCLVFSNTKASTGGSLNLTVSTNNGSTYVSSGYKSGIVVFEYNTTTIVATITSPSSFCLTPADVPSTQTMTGYAYLMNVQNGGDMMITGACTYSGAAGSLRSGNLCGFCTTANVNAIKITPITGNVSTGTFSLYGIIE